MISPLFIADRCPMNESRQSASRNSTVDSGFGSATASERSSTLDSRTTSRTESALSRDTPTTELGNTTPKEVRVNRPGKRYLCHYILTSIFSPHSSYSSYDRSMLPTSICITR